MTCLCCGRQWPFVGTCGACDRVAILFFEFGFTVRETVDAMVGADLTEAAVEDGLRRVRTGRTVRWTRP